MCRKFTTVVFIFFFPFSYPDGVHMQDLEAGVHYALWVEVPRQLTINGTRFEALKSFLTVLSKVIRILKFIHLSN